MRKRDQVYKKYYESDIFGNNPNHISLTVEPPRLNLNLQYHPTFEHTKQDVFNINKEARIKRDNKEHLPTERTNQSAIRRRKIYDNVYGSDIFNRGRARSTERRRNFGGLDRGTNRNISHCFEEMKNDEEYVRDLKEYQDEHRTEKKVYNPNIYIDRETAEERYYRDHYDRHGLIVLPESNYDTEDNNEYYRRLDYVHKKRAQNREMKKYNDVGADKKHPGGNSANYPEGVNLTGKFGKKKLDWVQNNNSYRYIDPRDHKMNTCQINNQIFLTSNVLRTDKDKNFEKDVEEINNRIEQEKHKIYRMDVLGNPIKKYNKNNDNNDRSLLGAVHSRWGRTNIDWKNPDTEIMFGKEFNDGINKNYGPKGPTPFQRKINQLADTKNYDTISGVRNSFPIYNIQKPPKEDRVNSEARRKVNDMVNTLPNLDEGQKLGIKMKISSLDVNDENFDDKAKTMREFYKKNNIRRAKREQEVTGKVNNRRDRDELKQKHLNDIDFHDYTLTYGTKGGKFERYDENDLKKIFGLKGVNIYDVQKNPFDKGDYNIVRFKVRYEDENFDDVSKRIQNVQDDFIKKNYKVKIEKGGEKNFKKNERHLASKPGAKLGFIMDPGYNSGYKGRSKYFKLIPMEIRAKKGFTKQFANVNYGYKKFNP